MLEVPAVIFSICTAAIFCYLFAERKTSPLPPGPRGLPIFGLLFEFPRSRPWFDFAKHRDIYGPISSVSVLGQTFVILNDRAMASELLDGRSAIYSDRPGFVFAKLAGLGNLLPVVRYGAVHKAQRKVVQQSFGSKNTITRLWPVLEVETRRFLARTLTEPEELGRHSRTLAGSIILKATYGYSVETGQPDPLIQEAENSTAVLLPALRPGAWLVDAIPALQYIPDWMPGSSFKRTARMMRKCLNDFAERPFLFVKDRMAAGYAHPSFVSKSLQELSDQHGDSAIKWAATSMYAGGEDTTLATISSFFLAMVLFPTVQKKAQEEIDSVVGPDRLPTLSDQENLPYVDATVKEVLRWHTVAPMCIAHVVMQDDIYRGYLIPKGSIILPNIWFFNHDPVNHHDPFAFKPERFLGVDGFTPETNPNDTVFGFGRRICAGKSLAQSSIFLTVAMSLATLNVEKARDASGVEMTPLHEMTDDTLSHPKAFKCRVAARSSKARDLVMTPDHDELATELSDGEIIRGIVLPDVYE